MTEQAKLYMLITNERGEMCVFLTPPEPYGPEPAKPEIVYGGGENALLYRNANDAVILDYIAEDRRKALAAMDEVLVVEYDPRALAVTREYMAAVKIVGRMPSLENSMVTKEELAHRLGEISRKGKAKK